MDDAGNILVRRYSKSNVYIKSCSVQNGSEAEPVAIPLEPDKIVKVSYYYMYYIYKYIYFVYNFFSCST